MMVQEQFVGVPWYGQWGRLLGVQGLQGGSGLLLK